MKLYLMTLAFLLAMFLTTTGVAYMDDGGGMARPNPSTDRELTVR